MSDEHGYLPEAVHAWIAEEAREHYDGNFGRAAAAFLIAAWQREQHPEDPWAEQDERLRQRRGV